VEANLRHESWTGDCEATRSGPIGLAEARGNGYVFSDMLLKKKKKKKKKKVPYTYHSFKTLPQNTTTNKVNKRLQMSNFA